MIRIVRLYFTETGETEFLKIFNQYKTEIRNFPGCTHLQLLKDKDLEFSYSTLSHWNNQSDLENYRNSELFINVWAQTKKLFSQKPISFSLDNFIDVEPY